MFRTPKTTFFYVFDKKTALAIADIKICTTFAIANTGIAQLVEHRSPKPSVGSSSLSSRAKDKSCKLNQLAAFFISYLFPFYMIKLHNKKTS